MARMIPPAILANTPSPGELEIFKRLRDDPDTKDWIVLHSLDVAEHDTQVAGEIDFVVIIPHMGVLCLEVKACHSLHRSGGLWYYGTNSQPDLRGPFKQASTAMHSIRQKLFARRPDLSGTVFWSAVIFPYLPFTMTSYEWHEWQVVDSRLFRLQPLSKSLYSIIEKARAHLVSKPSSTWFKPDRGEPDLAQCDSIAAVLRPDFEYFEHPKSRVSRLHAEIKHYTEEQFIALDAMEANDRVVYRGLAGTGKTMLAIEAARRSSKAGRSVLFLCYNRLLGKWLEDELKDLAPRVTCRTLHKHMLDVAGISKPGQGDTFWHDELPLRATDQLLESEGEEFVCDELVLDEAQDILRDSYLDFLDLSLRGGLAAGRWRLFGDFDRQAIYDAASVSIDQFLAARGNHAPVYTLRVNCRNPPRIAELVQLLGGAVPGYTKILRPDDGQNPQLSYYSTPEQQEQLLVHVLEQLQHDGLPGNDIVILSPRANTQCAAAAIRQVPWKDKVRPLEAAGPGHIAYSSLHAFKGMEAPAIVVTDVNRLDAERAMSLFYVATTRALHRLVILMHEDVKTDILALLGLSGR